MTGWRLGYIAGPKHFVAACGKIQSQACMLYFSFPFDELCTTKYETFLDFLLLQDI